MEDICKTREKGKVWFELTEIDLKHAEEEVGD